jgi:cytochrome c oxidase assembly factor 7
MMKNEKEAEEYLKKIGEIFYEDCYKESKPEACHQYAEYLMVGKKEPMRALEVFLNICENMKFAESCLAVGNMYVAGNKGPSKDLKLALKYFEKACSLGSMGGCNNGGLVYQNGLSETEPPNHVKAVEYFHKSCQGDFKNGCFNLSVAYLQGRGDSVSKDMNKALEYSLKSCELDHPWGCANASRILRLGDGGIDKDLKRAEQLLSKAKRLSKPQ